MKLNYHQRVSSESDKEAFLLSNSKPLSARQRLLEKGLKKDQVPIRNRSRNLARSTERLLSLPYKPISLNSHNQTLNFNNYPSIPKFIDLNRPTSKSPTSTRRKKSYDSTKNSDASSSNLGFKASNAKIINPPSNLSRRRTAKPTDAILKIAEQFSVKKINVIYIQELYSCRSKDDELLCRCLLVLLSEVDYHIKENPSFPIENFFDYISSPGIVVQTIKRIPEMIVNERISLSNFYVVCIQKTLEMFNCLGTVSNLTSFGLLIQLFQEIFNFKGLEYKSVNIGKQDQSKNENKHRRENLSLDFSAIAAKKDLSFDFGTLISKPEKRCISPEKKITEIRCISPEKKNNLPEKKVEKNVIAYERANSPDKRYSPDRKNLISSKFFEEKFAKHVEIEESGNFMESKSALLDKFFSKMGLSKLEKIEREKSPAKEFLNRSMEYIDSNLEKQCYIKIKKSGRPSSTTPRSMGSKKSSEKTILNESSSNKKMLQKSSIENLKQKHFLLGSRFFAKIDSKFIEYLSEKLKKDPKDLKMLKNSNYEEYKKRKNQYIQMYKNQWVNETLRHLESSDLLTSFNENDLNPEAKHEAMLNHLSQDKHINLLIRKAEQAEIVSRKIKNL